MNSNTVNIALKKELLKEIDEIAKEESKSRSQLISEAVSLYIERKKTWKAIFSYGENIAKNNNITEKDVIKEIAEYRK